MEDLSQLNIPLPVEAGSTAPADRGTQSNSDNAVFEGLLAEAESANAPAAGADGPESNGAGHSESTSQSASTNESTTTQVPSGAELPEVLSEALENLVPTIEPSAVDVLVENPTPPQLDTLIADLQAMPPVVAEPSVQASTVQENPEVIPAATPNAVQEVVPAATPNVRPEAVPELIDAPDSGDVRLSKGPDADPSSAGKVELQNVSPDLNAGLDVNTASRTAEDDAVTLIPQNPDTGRVNSPLAHRGSTDVTPTTGAQTPLTVVGTGVLNPFVGPGDGKSLKSLDLETFGVSRIEISADGTTSDAPTRVPATVITSEAVSPTAPRPEPTLAMLGLRSGAAVSSEAQVQTPVTETASVLESGDADTAVAQSVRPEVTTVSGAGLESQVTSQYVVKEGTPVRRIAPNSTAVRTEATLNGADKDSTTSIVRMTSEIPAETDVSTPHTKPQTVAPAQPVKPMNLPTFSLEPARRVTMMLGESDAGVRVQLSENHGEVSVRFEAGGAVRSGLEGSVNSLLQSLGREQVQVSDVLFSGHSNTGTDSGQKQQREGNGPQHARSAATATENLDFMTEFESSDIDSLISLTA